MQTSLITILSSAHGRLRREQRDIDKLDLQRALKYGIRKRVWGQRWSIEYDGITFITDSSMRQDITAYPSPLPPMPIDTAENSSHLKAKTLLQEKPELSTSHTVVIIDNSGSMLGKKNDIHLYRDSQNAAFSMTALELVAEQLFSETATNSDLVSLVKFSSDASVEISREPIGWPLYNKFLTHRNSDKFVDRQLSPSYDVMMSQSNFLPALDKATELLQSGYHEQCALSLFFFSDGQSTDHQKLGLTRAKAIGQMENKLTAMASQFGQSLSVKMVGLGSHDDDFSALCAMASAASSGGAKGSFEVCSKTANSISSVISSVVTSTMETRKTMQEGAHNRYTQREDLLSEKDSFPKFNWKYFSIANHFIYNPAERGFVRTSSLPPAASQTDPRQAASRQMKPPPYIAINRNYVGNIGAERVAFRARLSDKETADGFVFDTMVAKETKDIERIDEKIEFHTGFAETQDLANYLAAEFNRHVRGLPHYDPLQTPQILFLSCSVLLLSDPSWPGGLRGVLVEKMLDVDNFRWTKWNDNNGKVEGGFKQVPLDVDFELKQLRAEQSAQGSRGLGAITEEDEDESDDEESVSDLESDEGNGEENEGVSWNFEDASGIKPSDYLQAFTHFTYRYTNKKVMVCDLQGVFNTEMSPPTFELTDPALHYASAKGRRRVFGRTDKGKSGMNNFFRTHKCTKVCKFLQLSAKNRKWNRNWRQDSAGDSHRHHQHQHRPQPPF
jgi:hypothetical protein